MACRGAPAQDHIGADPRLKNIPGQALCVRPVCVSRQNLRCQNHRAPEDGKQGESRWKLVIHYWILDICFFRTSNVQHRILNFLLTARG